MDVDLRVIRIDPDQGVVVISTSLIALIQNRFSGFYEMIHDSQIDHLHTNRKIRISFEDEDKDKVPIESEDEYAAFVKFLTLVEGKAKIFVEALDVSPKKEVEKTSEADDKQPKKDVAFSLCDPMSSESNMSLPKPMIPDPVSYKVKVREATSNDPWGPSSHIMSEIADQTYNAVAFTEIMQMIWERLSDHGKNWRHVYKALVLLEYLIKAGSEKVVTQCKENISAIQTLRDFQYVDENKDHGVNVREKAKQLAMLLRDDERLNNERMRALKAKERSAQATSGFGSDTGLDSMSPSSPSVPGVKSSKPKGSEASVRFVAGLENNCDSAINHVTEKFLKKDETQSAKSVSADDEVPVWLKKYLAEFRENLLEEVKCIVKEQFNSDDEDGARANASREIQERINENDMLSPESYFSLAFELESFKKREKNLKDQLEKAKFEKMGILERMNAISGRMPPMIFDRSEMDAKVVRGRDMMQVKMGEEFLKIWHIANNGSVAWGENTEFRLYGTLDELKPKECVIPLPKLKPYQIHSITVPFESAGRPGLYTSIWAFFHMGKQFGQTVYCHINVVPETEKAKSEEGTKEADKRQKVNLTSGLTSEVDSDDSSNSIAVIDGENHDDEAGFVVVPMPPCFFPDKPQDSAVNVVVKPGKKSEQSQENGKADQAAKTSGIRGMLGKIKKQALKKPATEKHSTTETNVPKPSAASNKSASGSAPVQSEEDPIGYEYAWDLGCQVEFLDPYSQPTEAQWEGIRAYERIQESKLIKLFEEGRDAEGWQKYHELKMLKTYNEALANGLLQYQVPAMVPDLSYGLPQHPFNPVQARYPIPLLPFQAGFINTPFIPRPDMGPVVPPTPPMPNPVLLATHHAAPPAPAPPAPAPPAPAPPQATHPMVYPHQVPPDLANSIYLQPCPYGRPMSDDDDYEQPIWEPIRKEHTCSKKDKSQKKPASANGQPESQKKPTSANSQPVDLSKKPADKLDESTKPNQSDNAFFNQEILTIRPSFSKTLVEKKISEMQLPKDDTRVEKEVKEKNGGGEIEMMNFLASHAQAMDEKRGAAAQIVNKEKENVPMTAFKDDCLSVTTQNEKRGVESENNNKENKSVPVSGFQVEGSIPVPADVVETDNSFVQLPENQPYVDILPESLVNGVISAVNTASSACATAINTLAQTRRQTAQQTDKSVYDDPKFQDSIAQLYEMGFYNYEKNCRLLKKYNFAVEEVVSHYCSEPNEI